MLQKKFEKLKKRISKGCICKIMNEASDYVLEEEFVCMYTANVKMIDDYIHECNIGINEKGETYIQTINSASIDCYDTLRNIVKFDHTIDIDIEDDIIVNQDDLFDSYYFEEED